ncbi:hypothetical protein T492DRAFT_1144702 [Pavlovales sp. CCMP2436]|nr:hypothetical protein T492DRAFT_1144702 [Pavlovales sp. CCMP2436]
MARSAGELKMERSGQRRQFETSVNSTMTSGEPRQGGDGSSGGGADFVDERARAHRATVGIHAGALERLQEEAAVEIFVGADEREGPLEEREGLAAKRRRQTVLALESVDRSHDYSSGRPPVDDTAAVRRATSNVQKVRHEDRLAEAGLAGSRVDSLDRDGPGARVLCVVDARDDDSGHHVDEPLVAEPARDGHIEVVKWLFAQGYDCGDAWHTGQVCRAAAKGGHLEVLQLLCSRGVRWDNKGSGVCAAAAGYGRLDVLKWAHAAGCPWDGAVSGAAALHGHLELLQWAYDEGCPCDERVCARAALKDDFKMLAWAHSKGVPCTSGVLNAAVLGGNLQIAQWLHARGVTWLTPCHWTLKVQHSNGNTRSMRRWVEQLRKFLRSGVTMRTCRSNGFWIFESICMNCNSSSCDNCGGDEPSRQCKRYGVKAARRTGNLDESVTLERLLTGFLRGHVGILNSFMLFVLEELADRANASVGLRTFIAEVRSVLARFGASGQEAQAECTSEKLAWTVQELRRAVREDACGGDKNLIKFTIGKGDASLMITVRSDGVLKRS